jgi:hypothetical protein
MGRQQHDSHAALRCRTPQRPPGSQAPASRHRLAGHPFRENGARPAVVRGALYPPGERFTATLWAIRPGGDRILHGYFKPAFFRPSSSAFEAFFSVSLLY